MSKHLSFKKRLCDVCQLELPPVWVKQVGERHICVDCLKFIKEEEEVPPQVTENSPPSTTTVQSLDEENSQDIIEAVKSFLRLSNIKVIARSVSYLGLFLLIQPDNKLLYPAMQGALGGDAASWLTLSFFDMPFKGTGFAIEFLLYSGIIGTYAIQQEAVLTMPEDPDGLAIAFLAFLGVAFAKISYWAVKTLVFEEED